MAKLVFPRSLMTAFGIEAEIEIEATNVRALLRLLESRHPGIRAQIDDGMSIAIDGELYSDPLFEELPPDAEVHFLPRLRGG